MININDYVFYPLERSLKNKLIKKLKTSENDAVAELGLLSGKYSLNAEIKKNKMLWMDRKNKPKLVLYYNIKSNELDKIIKVYKDIKKNPDIQYFILARQYNSYENSYHIFRFNRLSYLQHCNYFPIQKVEPEKLTQKNINEALFNYFRPHTSTLPYLTDSQRYKWGRIFSDPDQVNGRMRKKAAEMGFSQKVDNGYIIWMTKNKQECLFKIIHDPTQVDVFIKLLLKIKKENIRLAYCVVRQLPDGDDEYDIFRLSQNSYLEHCNRVNPRKK